ncbi:MAG: nucleoside 2-deoxyribosyltransferase [Patescibacteria group bacterium]|nr:nucleoside 2-deoxyribosyltransferase [Patescibacteria group bacterium]
MKIYFAGSIRGGRRDKKIYFEIIKILNKYGKVLTEHVGDKKLNVMGERRLSERKIYKRDQKWLRESDLIVAEVTQPSLGVGYEIGKFEDKKPVLCLYREIKGKSLSAMIAGNPNVEVVKYRNLKEVKDIFKKFLDKIKNKSK